MEQEKTLFSISGSLEMIQPIFQAGWWLLHLFSLSVQSINFFRLEILRERGEEVQKNQKFTTHKNRSL